MLLVVFCLIGLIREGTSSGCLSDKRFDDEHRLTKLETAVNSLKAENLRLKESTLAVQAELAAVKNVFRQCISSKENKSWELQRINFVFPSLAKVQLHVKSLTYNEILPPSLLPKGTKAIIISVFCNFWNTGGHAYLDFDVHQKGNEAAGITNAKNTHFKVYANNFYYELMVPWNGEKPDEVVFKVSNTYNTGSNGGKNLNWYQVKIVGYISM